MAKLCLPLGFVLAVMISAAADNCVGGDCKAIGASSMLQSKASKAATAKKHYAEDVRPPANSSLVAKAFAPTTPTTADPFDGREEEPRRGLLQKKQVVLENVALDDDADDAAEFKKLLVTIKADLEGAGVLDSLAQHGVNDDKLHNLGIDIVQRLTASTITNISEVLPPADILAMLTEDDFSSSQSDDIMPHLATLGELVMAAHIGSGSLLARVASQDGRATSVDGTLAIKDSPPRRRAPNTAPTPPPTPPPTPVPDDGKRLGNQCPSTKPHLYPGTHRCFAKVWGGGACNYDPATDPAAHHRADRQCKYT